MINIHIEDKIIERHREYIKNSLIKKKINILLKKDKLSQIESEYGECFKKTHVEFCKCLIEEYSKMEEGGKENIFLGTPQYLYEFVEKVKRKYGDVQRKIREEEGYSKSIFDIFDYDKFVESHGFIHKCAEEKTYNIDNFEEISENFKWGAYAYVLSLKVKVCPYCNRNYITPIYSEDGKMRADLDHFYAKKQYPYLSLSLFNLVPSCKYCNSSLKGSEEFTYTANFHPLDKVKAESLYRMTYKPKSMLCFFGEEDFDIDLEYNIINKNWEKIRHNVDIFKIQEIYQYHRDVVTGLLRKRYVYDEGYIEYLLKSYHHLFASREEVVDFLVAPYDITQMENVPLGKLIRDLIEEMYF